MAPRIIKQTKIILKDKEKEAPTQSDPLSPRLTLEMDPVLFTVSIKLISTLNCPGI
jgi:hypothetical protein